MITCDINLCVERYHEMCQMRFCHGIEDKKNLLNRNSKCCLARINKIDDTEEKQFTTTQINKNYHMTLEINFLEYI